MKIAILSDIHANAPAFEAVIQDLKKRKIQHIWNLGDILGYGPFPEEVVGLLRKLKVKSIIGNYDIKVLEFKKYETEWRRIKDPAKFFSFRWTHEALSLKTQRYLKKLPQTRKMRIGGFRCLLVHGSPEFIDEGLRPQTPLRRFKELAKKACADIVASGHSHRFFVKKIGKTLFVNPGSIGRPFDGDVRTSYAILEIKNKKVKVIHRRLFYDLKKLRLKMMEEHFPLKLYRSIVLGKSIDDLEKERDE